VSQPLTFERNIPMVDQSLPVAVIGAGPVGLAAAAHLVAAGETLLVLEAGDGPGASVRAWSHVRVFSPWQSNVDRVARALLEEAGWSMPDPDTYPTGAEIVKHYLAPLASLPAIEPHVRYGARVTAVTRLGFDKMKTAGREQAPFLLQVLRDDGAEEAFLARAVIDASGTWTAPNPLGSSGVAAAGERQAVECIVYGIPDVLHAQRARYAGKRVLVIGSGHSAFNALADLVSLAAEEPATQITWAFRRPLSSRLFGGGEADQLPARGSLGARVQRYVERGEMRVVPGFRVARLSLTDSGVVVSDGERALPAVDEIIATTGFRPNLSILSELRLDLDPAVESTPALAPLIDPNVHSCGTVRPHGAEQLQHPEPDFYIVGMKSYGRAPTFLMLTGYEQVRSVVAAIRGDWEAAREVQLVLPETGACSTRIDSATNHEEPALVGATGAVCCG
jgi:thioredoxin reductase